MTYMLKQAEKNKRKIGSFYEEMAAEYLKQKGYQIIARNYRCHFGEIDLIAEKQGVIAFVEVKYRKTTCYGYPREAVGPVKQQHIHAVAQHYMRIKYHYEIPCEFDVIEILGSDITLLQGAF